MWKESYRLGIDEIDRQHMELFRMTTRLIEAVKNPDINKHKEECIQAILFLKKYSLEHFACEENYQKSIQYAGYTAHCQLHNEFVARVLMHESQMASSNFDMADIESFIGMLTAWLAYHVADADQKIVRDKHPHTLILDCFYAAICHSLNKMANVSKKNITRTEAPGDQTDDISVSVTLDGDISAVISYAFTNEFAMRLLKRFLFMSPKSMDSLVCTILLEVLNTISKNAVMELAKENVICQWESSAIKFKSPARLAKEAFVLSTPIGRISVGVHPAERSLL